MKDAHEAKRKVLENLKKEMAGADDGGLRDVLPKMKQKVVVASDSSEGISKGLDKAKEILNKRSEMMPEMAGDELESESEEEAELVESEEDENDPEVLKAKIAELKAQLARK